MTAVTIGRYYNGNSPIHRLDSRTKLASTMLFIVGLMFVSNPVIYLPCFAYVLVLYRLAAIPWRYIGKALKGILVLLVFTLVFQSMIATGQPLFSIGIITITKQGIVKGIRLAARIALMILMASLLSYTTTPTQMANGLEKSLSFLQRFHVPVHEMAMMVSIAFRFIPVLFEQANHIMEAQTCRGVDFESGNIIRRMGKLMPLIIPLFVSAVKRSADLAMAMEARGYTDAEHRTKYKPLRYTKSDFAAYGLMIAVTIALISSRVIFG